MAGPSPRIPFSQRLDDPDQAAIQHSHGEFGEQVSPHTMSAAVDQAHIQLIQQVQHELRTPVHGLLGLVEDLRTELRAAPIQDRDARRSLLIKAESLAGLSERLQHVLDDFRDFAAETIHAREAEEEHEVQPEEPVDLGDLLDTVAAEAWNEQVRQIRAEDGDDARLPPPPELILQTDTSLRGWKTVVSTQLVKKLAHKLISNALRFTTEGYVEVSLSPSIAASPWNEQEFSFRAAGDQTSSDQHYIDLVVEDSGEGMTEHFLSHRLFEPFVKADNFKAGAGLSVNLCSSIVRRMGGAMHVSSDKGRGTIVTVKLPVQSLPERIVNPAPASQSDQLIYLYGFEGPGLQRLAQVISAQLATFGNLYCTSHIQDADFLLLPEEVCLEVEGGIDAILAQTKPAVKIGVLQAHEDAGIEYAAFKNGSRRPTFVTRKPFGPRCFANLLRLAEQNGEEETRTAGETIRKEHGHLGYTAPVDPDQPGQVLREGAGTPLAKRAETGDEEYSDLQPRRMSVVSEQEKRNSDEGSTAIPGPHKLADLIVPPDALDEVLRAPHPKPRITPPNSTAPVAPSEAGSADADSPSPTTTTPPKAHFSVLCCEDNPLNMRILTTMLRQAKIEFHEAVDGVEAVAQFQKHLPAVTLLDINMPRMMGFEACQLMRQHVAETLTEEERARRGFKIVAVTALSDHFHQQKGMECGMDDWFTKPLQMRKLKADLAEWRSQYEALQEE
ncbi:Histidine kinase-like ATPase, ATP-binding domain protein [Kalmanozyma brasiliensis GHG001]|uniref:histidine kinase n=1 Tax=Kalmanozyma brasiliensis (strain GHG001) TaxID=1365824 RepID=V5EFJ0_KALBG|nr:Histidine kinase-like ATPase, ATP-binding domain protein [Kalmanozyma brasiliensis GHG001]EST09261.1 Histidine kinase-like ATPase, ATP-binding domain protein [Kalmanozyma brasiliensis GHG001]